MLLHAMHLQPQEIMARIRDSKSYNKLFHRWNWNREFCCGLWFFPVEDTFLWKDIAERVIPVKTRLLLAGSQ
jgi:hypothetical protein